MLVTGDRITKTLVNEEMREGEEGDRVKEEREKAVIAIQKNQEMLQVWFYRTESVISSDSQFKDSQRYP